MIACTGVCRNVFDLYIPVPAVNSQTAIGVIILRVSNIELIPSSCTIAWFTGEGGVSTGLIVEYVYVCCMKVYSE